MSLRFSSAWAAVLTTIGLLAVFSYVPVYRMWGFNHLAFLSGPSLAAFALLSLLCLSFPLLVRESLADRLVFRSGLWPRQPYLLTPLLIAAFAASLFYLLHSRQFLLGDATTWLAEFGQGESYPDKWTEKGAIEVVRSVQFLLGGYTSETAETAFRLLSVLSGGVYVVIALFLAREIAPDPGRRLLALSTLLFSGSILLFFGYIEFYCLSWIAAALCLLLSLRSLRGGPLYPALLTFALGVALHLQVLILLPAVALLPVLRQHQPSRRKLACILYGAFLATIAAVSIYLYQTELALQALILPLTDGFPIAPDYTVLSLPHLIDLINESLFVFPGIIVLLVVALSSRDRTARDRSTLFLAVASLSGLGYLLLYGAAITMARDWDVMALGLLPLALLLLHTIGRSHQPPSARAVLLYGILCLTVTASLLAVNLRLAPAEARMYTLLNDHNRSYWWGYANHFYLKGDDARYNEILAEMNERFPEYRLLSLAYRHLETREIDKAHRIADSLVQSNPLESNFLQILGNVYRKYARYDSADVYYRKAIEIQPYRPELLNEYGQLQLEQNDCRGAIPVFRRAHQLALHKPFITEGLALAFLRCGHLDSAAALSDTLFQDDPSSPGGHLIRVVTSLAHGDTLLAQSHLHSYLLHGASRSDYTRIRTYYNWLLPPTN